MKHHEQPWMIPVPVKPSGFTPVFKEHDSLNVEVDLSALTSFCNRTAPIPSEQLMYSDLQTNADTNIERRLGSGRSGAYQGKYLKGIGRTQIAGNWNGEFDLYHSSGALFPSGAIREFMVSRYLKSLGKEHLITPCEGLLLKPLPPGFENHPEHVFKIAIEIHGKEKLYFAPADYRFQAISVKNADFSRLSNFAWWLSNFPQYQSRMVSSSIALFFETFYQALTFPITIVTDLDAEKIAKTFSKTVNHTIENFFEAWEAGVNWGSLHNNFTMDGRFLDLETPTVLPPASTGVIVNAMELSGTSVKEYVLDSPGRITGFEVISYLRQVRIFIQFFKSRLAFLCEAKLVSSAEIEFIRDFIHALDQEFPADHPCFLQDAREELVINRITKKHDLSSNEVKELRKLNHFKSTDEAIKLYRASYSPLAPSEAGFTPVLFLPGFMLDRPIATSNHPSGFNFNTTVLEAEKLLNLDEIVQYIQKV